MKANKIIYWIATGLLSSLLLFSSGMYIFNNEMIRGAFISLGYPTYLIYPLVIAKISAIIVLLTQTDSRIKEWAYAGLFFELILAFFAHFMIDDGEHTGALIGLILLVISYIFNTKIIKNKQICNI